MKILFIPSSICGGMKDSASDRIRCDWVFPYLDAEKCNGSQNLNNYEVLIFMKSFPLRVAMQYHHKLIIWDISDVWRFNSKEEIDKCLKYVDLVLIPCESLKDDFVERFPNTLAYVVPDGHKLESYDARKVHKDRKPVFVWHGYSGNFQRDKVQEIIREIEERYELIVISDESVGKGIFIKWNEETFSEEMIKGDICINPQYWFKSNNKTVTAWALGLPVVDKKEDIKRFLNYKERIKESEFRLKDINKYHVRYSAEMIKNLIFDYTKKKEYNRVKVGI